jgi:predicted PolB exonuclease-like 3'-5' exonuclease
MFDGFVPRVMLSGIEATEKAKPHNKLGVIMNLYIDIETIPSQKPDAKSDIIIEVPGNYSKPESIEKWELEKKPGLIEKEYQKFGLDGALGEIICIGLAFDDGPPISIGRKIDQPEGDLLAEFMATLSNKKYASMGKPETFKWIGHYITGFDLRFIWQRCVVNGIEPSINIPIDAKPWETDLVFDTMTQWTGIKKSGTGKLDKICKALGHKGKGSIDGSKVWEHIKAGKYAEVFEYCKDDVEMTRFLYKRLTFNI